MDINKRKMATSKFFHFSQKTLDLPLGKKVDFWTQDKYSLKSIKSNQCVRNRPQRHFLGLPRDHGQRNSPQNVKSAWELNRTLFVRELFALKNDYQESFTIRRDPMDINKRKMPTSKLSHF